MRWIFSYGRRRNCAELLRGSLLGRALGRGLFGSRSGGSSVFLCSSRSLLGSSGLLRSGGLLGSRGFFRGRGLGGRNSFSVSRLRGCGRLLGRSLLRRSGGSLLSGSRLLCGSLDSGYLAGTFLDILLDLLNRGFHGLGLRLGNFGLCLHGCLRFLSGLSRGFDILAGELDQIVKSFFYNSFLAIDKLSLFVNVFQRSSKTAAEIVLVAGLGGA